MGDYVWGQPKVVSELASDRSLILPATSEREVKLDNREQLIKPDLYKYIFGREELLLLQQNLEIARIA